MKKILILTPYYLPGYKGGGPIQSCHNLVENLYEEFEFYILCSDRDHKSKQPYGNIKINDWNKVEHAMVYYMSPEKQTLKGFKKILNETEYDILYLNGFFSPIFTIKPLILKKLKKIKNKKIILTPRGDFTGGCENKKIKKYTYIIVAKVLGLYKNLIWQATSEIEKKDIKKKFKKANVFIAENMSEKFIPKKSIIDKKEQELKLIFVSRIFPKKNIKYALEILKNIKEGNVTYDIYGPMEDAQYWEECEKIIKQMPKNVKVNYCGELSHNQIGNTFQKYHAFFFPTLGENYGHVIIESIMNNCIAILSKETTPWDEYLSLLGTGSYLKSRQGFVNIINRFISMNNEEFKQTVLKNNKYVATINNNDLIIEKYIKAFKKCNN